MPQKTRLNATVALFFKLLPGGRPAKIERREEELSGETVLVRPQG